MAVFEFETILYPSDNYLWNWNKKGNLQGHDKVTSDHKFTWQPHGSQFTILEQVPKNRLAIRIKQPPALDKNEVLRAIQFDSSWVQILD